MLTLNVIVVTFLSSACFSFHQEHSGTRVTVVQIQLTFWHQSDSVTVAQCTNTAHTFWHLNDRCTVQIQLTFWHQSDSVTVVELRLTFWHLNDSCTNTAHTFWQLSDRMTVVHLQLTVSCTSGSRPCLTTRPSCGYNGPIQVGLWPSGPYLIDCKYLWGLYTGPSSPPPPPLYYTHSLRGARDPK